MIVLNANCANYAHFTFEFYQINLCNLRNLRNSRSKQIRPRLKLTTLGTALAPTRGDSLLHSLLKEIGGRN